MENVLKNFIYTAVGFASIAGEKIKKSVDSLVEDEKISTKEGKKIVDDFFKNTNTKRDEMESQFSSLVEKVIKSFNFASKKDIDKLANRITVLEAIVANMEEEEVAKEEVKKEEVKVKKTTTRTKKATTTKAKKDEE